MLTRKSTQPAMRPRTGHDQTAEQPTVVPETGQRRLTPATVLHMQRLHGNRATQQFLDQRVRRKPRPMEAFKEAQGFSLTGRYEYFDTAGGRWMLHINHAGAGFTGTLEHRQAAQATGSDRLHDKRQTFRIIGDRNEDGTQKQDWGGVVEDGEYTAFTAAFTRLRDNRVMVVLDYKENGKMDMVQTSTQPRMEGVRFGNDEAGKIAQLANDNPLDQFQRIQIQGFVQQLANKIETDRESHSITAPRIPKIASANDINNLVKSFFENQWLDKNQLPLAMREVQMMLSRTQTKQRSLLVWLSDIVRQNAPHTAAIQRYLGLDPKMGQGIIHKYAFNFALTGKEWGAVVSAGLWAGIMHIEKTAPNKWSSPQDYAMSALSFGAGLNFGSKWATDGNGTMESEYDWIPANFYGSVGFAGVEGGAQGGVGGGYGRTAAEFRGDKVYPVMWGNASGFNITAGAGYSAGLAGMLANLKPINESPSFSDFQETLIKKPQPVSAKVDQSAQQAVHFAVDAALLTDDGKAVLRALATDNLALFHDPSTNLQIDGYTSRSGAAGYNKDLSLARAQTVLIFLQGVLGDQFRIKKATTQGHGEEAAAEQGEQDKSENAAWRKVEVKLNGTTVVTLQ